MILKFFKKLDCRNCINIPKVVVERFGREYYLEIYDNYIKIIPAKSEKEKEN